MSTKLRVALIAIVLALGAAAVAAPTVGLGGSSTRFSAEFSGAVGLYEGSEVRVLGVPVGRVTGVTPAGKVVKVEMEVDDDVPVAAETRVAIVAPTLVSDRFVQLVDPWSGGAKLRSGAEIGTDRTHVPVEIDQLYESINQVAEVLGPNGANAEGALSELIRVGAENFSGNGEKMRQVVTDLGQASRTLADSGEDIFGTFGHLDTLVSVLNTNDDRVRSVNARLASFTRAIAEDREVLKGALDSLGAALTLVESFIKANRGHLETSIGELDKTVRILIKHKASLRQMLTVLPVAVQNVDDAYDPGFGGFVSQGVPLDVLNGLRVDVGPFGPPEPEVTPKAPADAPLPLMLPEPEADPEEGGQ